MHTALFLLVILPAMIHVGGSNYTVTLEAVMN